MIVPPLFVAPRQPALRTMPLNASIWHHLAINRLAASGHGWHADQLVATWRATASGKIAYFLPMADASWLAPGGSVGTALGLTGHTPMHGPRSNPSSGGDEVERTSRVWSGCLAPRYSRAGLAGGAHAVERQGDDEAGA